MKKGFSLAELMVVMLVITILLAAMAPIMTKRRTTTPEVQVERMIKILSDQNKEIMDKNAELEARIEKLERFFQPMGEASPYEL